VAALEAMVPAGCKTFRPARRTASGLMTCYFGKVSVSTAFAVVEGRMVGKSLTDGK
jgi:hypothetical protein